jgi:hypothetical protein
VKDLVKFHDSTHFVKETQITNQALDPLDVFIIFIHHFMLIFQITPPFLFEPISMMFKTKLWLDLEPSQGILHFDNWILNKGYFFGVYFMSKQTMTLCPLSLELYQE